MRDLRVSFPKPCDERWEEMKQAAGCDRVCERCDHLVHDLARYTIDEAEALLRANPGSCVRARIGADGTVALKPARGGTARQMMVAAAATAGVLAASAPALAKRERPTGAIAGGLQYGFQTRVEARSEAGRTYRTRVDREGRFRFERLPAGTYSVTFIPDCGDTRTIENVVVREGQTDLPQVQDLDRCIIIGQVRIEEDRA